MRNLMKHKSQKVSQSDRSRRKILALFFGFVGLAFQPLVILSAEEEPLRKENAYISPFNSSINESCVGEILVDKPYIVGGVKITAKSPTESKKRVTETIDQIKKYVSPHGGIVTLLDTVRSVHDINFVQDNEIPGTKKSIEFTSFQLIEVEFSKEVDIDLIFQGLVDHGLNIFGRNVSMVQSQYEQKYPIRYRVRGFEEQAKKIVAECKLKAIQNYCRENTKQDQHASCIAAMEKNRIVTGYSLQSQSISMLQSSEYPNTSQISLYYPGTSSVSSNTEFLSSMTIKLVGYINIGTSNPLK